MQCSSAWQTSETLWLNNSRSGVFGVFQISGATHKTPHWLMHAPTVVVALVWFGSIRAWIYHSLQLIVTSVPKAVILLPLFLTGWLINLCSLYLTQMDLLVGRCWIQECDKFKDVVYSTNLCFGSLVFCGKESLLELSSWCQIATENGWYSSLW